MIWILLLGVAASLVLPTVVTAFSPHHFARRRASWLSLWSAQTLPAALMTWFIAYIVVEGVARQSRISPQDGLILLVFIFNLIVFSAHILWHLRSAYIGIQLTRNINLHLPTFYQRHSRHTTILLLATLTGLLTGAALGAAGLLPSLDSFDGFFLTTAFVANLATIATLLLNALSFHYLAGTAHP